MKKSGYFFVCFISIVLIFFLTTCGKSSGGGGDNQGSLEGTWNYAGSFSSNTNESWYEDHQGTAYITLNNNIMSIRLVGTLQNSEGSGNLDLTIDNIQVDYPNQLLLIPQRGVSIGGKCPAGNLSGEGSWDDYSNLVLYLFIETVDCDEYWSEEGAFQLTR